MNSSSTVYHLDLVNRSSSFGKKKSAAFFLCFGVASCRKSLHRFSSIALGWKILTWYTSFSPFHWHLGAKIVILRCISCGWKRRPLSRSAWKRSTILEHISLVVSSWNFYIGTTNLCTGASTSGRCWQYNFRRNSQLGMCLLKWRLHFPLFLTWIGFSILSRYIIIGCRTRKWSASHQPCFVLMKIASLRPLRLARGCRLLSWSNISTGFICVFAL